MEMVISFFVFWTTFFTVEAAQGWWTRTKNPLEERLQRLLQFDAPSSTRLEEPLAVDGPHEKALKESLILAGFRRKSDLKQLLFFKRLCLALPFGATLLLAFMGFRAGEVLFTGALLIFVFILLPRLWILHAIFKRRKEIEGHLADALDLFVLCLEAGLSFESALLRVAEEEKRVSNQMSRELLSTHQEIRVGKTREEALKNLAWRTRVADIQILVGAILQSLKLGTSLGKTLRIQADVLRKKKRERIRAEILKTPVKLIFPLLFLIFPTLLIVILGPSLVSIFRHMSEVGH